MGGEDARKSDEITRKFHQMAPAMQESILTYTAQNSFGVPMQSRAICRDDVWTDATKGSIVGPSINGFTKLDWLTYQATGKP